MNFEAGKTASFFKFAPQRLFTKDETSFSMLVLMTVLWTISLILIIIDPKTESTRWVVAICFFSGLGGFASVLNETVIPNFYGNEYLINILVVAKDISASLSHYFAPYSLLIYSIVFSEIFKERWVNLRLKVNVFLLIPPVFMYFLYPTFPEFRPSYLILSIWVTPYILIANFLMLYSYFKTKQPRLKQNKLLTCIIITPGTLMSLFTNYIFGVIKIYTAFHYNEWIILLQFSAFIYFAVRRGALGVKLSLEKASIDRTMKAITSGTSILNHTIKNEVSKISICASIIESFVVKNSEHFSGNSEISENIKAINDATCYLGMMINKIQNQVRDIVLQEQISRLDDIIDKAISMVLPYIKNKHIEISKSFNSELYILCDSLHLQETIGNIFNNAIEAIGSNGMINVNIQQTNRTFAIVIKDNGPGIPKENLSLVIEPFFSTKKRTNNFGLGLSYCYSVMQQHGGTLEISSSEGIGTTVLLCFPVKKVFRKNIINSDFRVGL